MRKVLAPYRQVLVLPGAIRFSAAGLLARLPISMLSLGTVLLVQAEFGSYGTAAAVAATLGITAAVAGPLLARLVDRIGQARVLRPALLVNALGMLVLIVSARKDGALWPLFAGALVAGIASVPIGSLVRARWSRLLAGSPGLHTAYSMESALDEVIFIVGPVVVTWLAARVSPTAGLLVAVVASLTGGYLLARQRHTEPVPQLGAGSLGPAMVRIPGMVVLFVVFLLVGGLLGAIEVATVAFAAQQQAPASAGLVLAIFALGSMVAGLAYGTIRWHASAQRRFRIAVVVLAVGVVPTALVPSLPALAIVLFVAGMAISPMIVAGYGLVGVLVAPARLTEGIAWATTGIALGANVGIGVTGPVIDAVGAQRAFVVPVALGLLAMLTVGLAGRWLVPRPTLAPAR